LSLNRTGKLPSKKGIILGSKRIIFAEHEITEVGVNSAATFKWSGIKSVEVGSQAIYIFVDLMAALIIPKRAFSDDKVMEEFLLDTRTRIESAREQADIQT
jgi:hypothetical protein